MTQEGIGSILVRDLLGELNLKPWWEEYRGYSFALSVTAALSMAYVLQSGVALNCLPHENTTAVLHHNFPTSVGSFVNTYCSSKISAELLYSGAFSLACCVLILLVSSYWLCIPKVIKAFNTYASSEKLVDELHLMTEQLEILLITPCCAESKKDVKKLRKACVHLWEYITEVKADGNSVRKYYQRRCQVLLVTCVAAMFFAIHMLNNNLWPCINAVLCCNFSTVNLSLNSNEYICTHKSMPLLFSLMLTFGVSVLAQLVFVVIGTTVAADKHGTERNNHTDNLKFIHIFRRNSRTSNSTCFANLCKFIYGIGSKSLKNKLKSETYTPDIYLIELYIKLAPNDWETIAKLIRRFLGSIQLQAMHNEDYTRLIAVAGRIEDKPDNLEMVDKLVDLLQYLYEVKYFWLFVTLLNRTGSMEVHTSITEKLRVLNLNLNVTGPSIYEARSVLYYALRKNEDDSICETATKRILETCDTSNVYVHVGGTSFRLADFVVLEGLNFQDIDRKLESLIKSVKYPLEKIAATGKRPGNPGSKEHGMKELADIKRKFDRRNQHLRNQIPCKVIARNISYLKFRTWNREMDEFAREICKQRQWEILVALVNTLIVRNDEDASTRLDEELRNAYNLIEVANLRDVELAHEIGILLYYALTKRDYQSFTPTAAAWVLKITTGMRRVVWIELENVLVELEEFIMEKSNLTLDQQRTILRLL